jgi:hypothetical protein
MNDSRVATVVVFVALAAVLGGARAASPVTSVQGDGHYTWLWARSLAYDGDLDLTNDYTVCGDPWGMTRRGIEGGPPANLWAFGPALLWVPLAWVGRLLHPSDPGCAGPVAELAMAASVLAALLALWLGYRLARRYVPQAPALLATLGVGLASPLPYYVIYLPSYGHAASAFAVALFLERWDGTRGERGPSRWAVLGVLLGLAMLMRPQNALIALAPMLEWLSGALMSVRARDPRRLGRWLLVGFLFVACATVVFAPQMILQQSMFGHPLAPPQGPHFMRWTEPHVAGVLFGTTGGLLFWSPLLYLSVIGLGVGLFRAPCRAPAAALLLVSLAMLYVNAAAWDWWGSVSFSNRRFIALTAVFVFGAALTLAPVFRWAELRPRWAASSLLLALVLAFSAWNLAAMSGVAHGRILTWREQPADHAWSAVFKELAEGVHSKVGNPLAWPASIPFVLRYRVHPKHFDAMHGMRVFYVNYEDLAPRRGEERVEFHKPLHQAYLVEGFEAKKVSGAMAAVAAEGRSRMLVPLFHGAVRGVEVEWHAVEVAAEPAKGALEIEAPRPPRVVLVWNGRPIAQADVPAKGRWHKLAIMVPEDVPRVGINELEWHVNGGPVAIRALEVLPASWLPAAVRFGERRSLNDRRTRPDRTYDGYRKSDRSAPRSTH